jgi:cytidylate kinase
LIEAIGRAGESVLVGRGAGFMLPRETTLSVRIIAPLRVRALRLAERMGVSVRTARRAARDLDRRRTQFDRTMHRMVSGDPHNYDLVIDSHSMGLDIATEVIVRAVEAGRPGALSRTTSWTVTARTPAEPSAPPPVTHPATTPTPQPPDILITDESRPGE